MGGKHEIGADQSNLQNFVIEPKQQQQQRNNNLN